MAIETTSPFDINVANTSQWEKAVKRFFFSDSFVKPYVKVEGLPDLLLRYERDKNSMNLAQMEIIAFLNLSSRGSYFFHNNNQILRKK